MAAQSDLAPILRHFMIPNPSFNGSGWRGERLRDDKRLQYGNPPAGNANLAKSPHIVRHLAPADVVGYLFANGSLSSNQFGKGDPRANGKARRGRVAHA